MRIQTATALFLTFLFFSFTGAAQQGPKKVREVRTLEGSETGVSSPIGLAYSPKAGHFLVVSKPGVNQDSNTTTSVAAMTPLGDLNGIFPLAAGLDDRINIAFDSVRQRLLLLHRNNRVLFSVSVGEDGRLIPSTQRATSVQHFGLSDPRGMSVDPSTGALFILDGSDTVRRIEPNSSGDFAQAAVSHVALDEIGSVGLRGIAVHPVNGHLHLLSPSGQELYEIDQAGSLISTYDLTGVVLTNPGAMTFAPTGDTTDDPERVSVYVAESGPEAAKLVKASSLGPGEITELLLETPNFVQATATMGLVQTILTSEWDPPSPDPSGITHYPSSSGLLISDGEVNEMSIYEGANVFRSSLQGNLLSTFNTEDRIGSNEPTGVTYKASNNRLFFSDDTNPHIYEVATGGDNVHGTSDDIVTSFATGPFGSNDPEGITYNPNENALYIADGVNDEIYRVLPGPDGLFNGSGDIVTSFDTASFGVTDPEGVEYNPDSNTLLIVGFPKVSMAETTLSGSLLRMIDISAAAALKPAGVAYASCSQNPSANCVYIVDRGVDNNNDPNENDGKIYEFTIPTLGNATPVVNAGPDQSIAEGSPAILDGTVSDDGKPAPPSLTTLWTQQSGPAGVVFANASAVDTTATLPGVGTYVLRLTANDGEIQSFDDVIISVLCASCTMISSRVSASSDDAEEEGGTGVMSLGSSDLEMVFSGTNQTVGMRFNGITIPRGATIVSASIQFKVDETGSVATNLAIQGQASDNAPTFTNTAFNISSRPRTTASVAWTPAPWLTVGEAGANQRTPDISPVIQQIVNRSGWSSGNSLVIIITGTGERVAESFNGDAAGAPLLSVSYITSTSPPTVTGISPTQGPVAGGTSVTISGTGFVAGATVQIGGVAATGVSVGSSTEITATTPAGTAGLKNVSVTTPGGTGTLNNGYTYVAAPTVTTINPNQGPTAGGTAVTISGTGFVSGATVQIGGVAATNVNVSGPTSLTATTGANAAGAANVSVTTVGGTGSLTNGFSYVGAPTVTTITPNQGPLAGGTNVTIAGTGFVAPVTVQIGGVAATNVNVSSSTSITATTPAGTVGPKNVSVTTTGGTGTLTNGFTYLAAPTVTTINPTQGPTAGGTNVTISGTGFVTGATVQIGGVAATGVSVGSSTEITATTPAGTAGLKNVSVTTPGGTGTLTNGFTYVAAPTVTTINPNQGPTAGGTNVTINGTGFVTGATVQIGGVAATNVNVSGPTSLTATTGANSAGPANVSVTTVGGTGSLTNGFTYVGAPTVTTITPNQGPLAGGTNVTIAGTGFVAPVTVQIGGVAATNVNVASSTSITATTPAGTVGPKNISVTTPGGTGSLNNGFTYLAAPTVTTINPNQGPTAGGTNVTINGTGFVTGATVQIGGVAATGVSVGSSSEITATTPAGTAGLKNVSVTTPGGTGTLNNGYTYVAAPTVTTVVPNQGSTAGGTQVIITGTNFTATSTVQIGGVAATGVIVNGATSITATTPANAAGPANVSVTTVGGTGSLTNGFTYVGAPTVTTITPNQGPTGGGTSVSITGTGFVAGATVQIGGVAATGVSVGSSTSITATAPAGTAGPANVSVTTTGGTGTLNNGYTYLAQPTVTTINPNQGPTAGGTNVTISGTGFVTGATVQIGGVAATNVNVSSATSLTATTGANTAGAVNVSVTTPGGTGTLNNGFTYVAAPTVTTINPNQGPTAGGTNVTISGTGFVTGATVQIGGVAATSVNVSSPTSLTATTGANAAGPANVSVTTVGGTGSLTNGFSYVGAPTVTTITPNQGPLAGGTNVTIAGTGFVAPVTVQIGGATASNVNVVNPTTITATTPAGTAGAATVSVTTPGGTGSLNNGFTYLAAPTVTTINPTQGPTAGGTNVTISGTGFVTGATVQIGGVAATNVNVSSATSLTATTGANTAGAVNVSVTTPGGTGTLNNGFTYVAAPTVTMINPNQGPTAGSTNVTINGTGFVTGATVQIGGVAATNVDVSGPTSLTATTGANSAGPANVSVTTVGGTGTLNNGFTYVGAPTVTAITPNQGPTGGGTSVSITGTGFVAGATMQIGGVAATSVNVSSSTSLTATTPAGTAGAANVSVTTSGGTGTLNNGFTYLAAPTVTAIAPVEGPAGGGTNVTITGTNFVAPATVQIGGVAATNVIVGSSTSITATTPAGTAGPKNVSVTTAGGTGTLNNGYTYVGLTISSLNPNSLARGVNNAPVIVNGTGFGTGAQVTFENGNGPSPTATVTAVTGTSISALVTTKSGGPPRSNAFDVRVTLPNGSSVVLPGGFTVTP